MPLSLLRRAPEWRSAERHLRKACAKVYDASTLLILRNIMRPGRVRAKPPARRRLVYKQTAERESRDLAQSRCSLSSTSRANLCECQGGCRGGERRALFWTAPTCTRRARTCPHLQRRKGRRDAAVTISRISLSAGNLGRRAVRDKLRRQPVSSLALQADQP
jgi:hypothetical protein